MKRRLSIPFLFAIAMMAGCGGGGGGGDDEVDCTGHVPTEEQLATLTCGDTTLDEAVQTLGEPYMDGSNYIAYREDCGASSAFLRLTFDSLGIYKIELITTGSYYDGYDPSIPGCE